MLVAGVSGRAALAADAPGASASNTVLVHTDAGDVTVADVRANLANLPGLTRMTILQDQAQLANMARLLAAQKLALKDALAKGWDKKPEIAAAIMAAVEKARANVILQTYFEADVQPPKDYPSDAEVQEAYDSRKAAFTTPRKYRYSQIVVALPKADDQTAQDKAAAKLSDIQQKLKANGADFGAIAATSSDDAATAKRRGDAGSVAENQIAADLKPVLSRLKAGEISQPLRRSAGWYIVKLQDVTEEHVQPLGEVRDQIRARLRNERAQQTAKARVDDFLQKVPELSPDALAELKTGITQ